MELQFVKADVSAELRRLREFDRKVFPEADLFPASYWRECEVYWLVVEGKRVGCCAVQAEGEGDLYIASTGVLPEWQGKGMGPLMKAWQVAYARRGGFRRILTETRESNARMIALNKQFGFRVRKRVKGYYLDPVETAVVMELVL